MKPSYLGWRICGIVPLTLIAAPFCERLHPNVFRFVKLWGAAGGVWIMLLTATILQHISWDAKALAPCSHKRAQNFGGTTCVPAVDVALLVPSGERVTPSSAPVFFLRSEFIRPCSWDAKRRSSPKLRSILRDTRMRSLSNFREEPIRVPATAARSERVCWCLVPARHRPPKGATGVLRERTFLVRVMCAFSAAKNV